MMCPVCGNSDPDGFDIQDTETHRVYRCMFCWYICKKTDINLLKDQKYQRNMGEEKS
jgi:hypothetical protein